MESRPRAEPQGAGGRPSGIAYLVAVPALAVAVVGFVMWRGRTVAQVVMAEGVARSVLVVVQIGIGQKIGDLNKGGTDPGPPAIHIPLALLIFGLSAHLSTFVANIRRRTAPSEDLVSVVITLGENGRLWQDQRGLNRTTSTTADTPGVEPSRSWVSRTQTPKAQWSAGDQAGGDDDLQRQGGARTSASTVPASLRRSLSGGDGACQSKLRQPADEEPTLHVSGGQPQGALERLAGFVVAAETAQQLGPGGMKIAVVAEIERVDELERLFGARPPRRQPPPD